MLTTRRWFVGILVLVGGWCLSLQGAVDITGRWAASFDTQIGRQDYIFQFQVKGKALTGTAYSASGETGILKGRVEDDRVTFVENFTYSGGTIAITYSGTIVSADEITFTRNVAGFATEELVARRVR